MTKKYTTIEDQVKILKENWTTPSLADDDTITVTVDEFEPFIRVETTKPKLQNLGEFEIRDAGLILNEVFLNEKGGITIEYAVDSTDYWDATHDAFE